MFGLEGMSVEALNIRPIDDKNQTPPLLLVLPSVLPVFCIAFTLEVVAEVVFSLLSLLSPVTLTILLLIAHSHIS